MWRKLGMVLSLFLLIGFAGCDNDEDDLVSYNSDDFYDDFSASERFTDWDDDADERYNGDEFSRSHFETWDTNDDNTIDEDEYNTATGDFDISDGNWVDWDVDENNSLNYAEFDAAYGPYDYYNTWDMDNDNYISDREYSDGVFDSWDFDNDGFIEENQYNALNSRYYGF